MESRDRAGILSSILVVTIFPHLVFGDSFFWNSLSIGQEIKKIEVVAPFVVTLDLGGKGACRPCQPFF